MEEMNAIAIKTMIYLDNPPLFVYEQLVEMEWKINEWGYDLIWNDISEEEMEYVIDTENEAVIYCQQHPRLWKKATIKQQN